MTGLWQQHPARLKRVIIVHVSFNKQQCYIYTELGFIPGILRLN